MSCALRLVFQDYKSSFNELLDKDNSVTVHHRNLQLLATELFKVKFDQVPSIVKDLFQLNENPTYELRNVSTFIPNTPRTVSYGIESLSYLDPKLWNIIPKDIKTSKSVAEFKSKIKKMGT